MSKAIAIMVGVILGGHGILGLFIEGRPLLLFNVDIALDLIHLFSAAVLLFVGRERASDLTVRGGLLLVGVIEIGTGLAGLADRHLGGLAPTGLFPLDFLLTFGLGGACLLGAVLPHAGRNIWETGYPSPPAQQ